MIDNFDGEYRFLSNFFCPSPVTLDGVVYPSVEHAYQAAKTLNPFERQMFIPITCGQAKRLGRKVTLRPDWEEVKIDVMRSLLKQKFAEGTELRQMLDLTKPEELVEGNTWKDRFWGVCEGVGENWLGKLLMEIRDGKTT